MRFQIFREQLIQLTEVADVTLRAAGLSRLGATVDFINILNGSVEGNAEYNIYELSEDQLTIVSEMLDAAIKLVGLQGAAKILNLVPIFQNPLPEIEPEKATSCDPIPAEDAVTKE